MLEKNTKCWICKRTEEEIIKEIQFSPYADEMIYRTRENVGGSGDATKNGIIQQKRASDRLGYRCPICVICRELIYYIAYDAAIDRIDWEKEEALCPTLEAILKNQTKG